MDDDKRIENNEEEAVSNDNIAGEEGETNSEERDKSRPYKVSLFERFYFSPRAYTNFALLICMLRLA